MYVTEATQFCVTAGSTLIFKSVQSRELGQCQLIKNQLKGPFRPLWSELEFKPHNCIHSDELLQVIVSSKSFMSMSNFLGGLRVGMASICKICAKFIAFWPKITIVECQKHVRNLIHRFGFYTYSDVNSTSQSHSKVTLQISFWPNLTILAYICDLTGA